jgi:hypothetical protein
VADKDAAALGWSWRVVYNDLAPHVPALDGANPRSYAAPQENSKFSWLPDCDLNHRLRKVRLGVPDCARCQKTVPPSGRDQSVNNLFPNTEPETRSP